MIDCQYLMRRILFSIITIAVIGISAFGASRAFFSDTETSTNNIFQAGVIDLLVDNTSYYNGVFNEGTSWELSDLPGHLFFNFLDLKPSDWGEDTISLHVNTNEAWACMNINLTSNDDNTCTEPENTDDPTCSEPDADELDGELAQNVNFVFWVDDGDNVLETNEASEGILEQGTAEEIMNGDTWALADSANNEFGGPIGQGLLPETTYYIGKAWCFGDLTLTPLTQDGVNNLVTPANTNGGVSCNGTALNNATQSDLLNADVSFSVVQHRNNPNFLCNPLPSPSATPVPTPTATPAPTPIACIDTFASTAHENNQGTRKNGSAVLGDRSVPSAMFGIPQTAGNPSDVGFPAGSFFSLGFTNGNIILGYASPFFQNPSGADLQVYEVTGGVYPDEKVKVEVATSLVGPWSVAVPNPGTRDAGFEMPIPSAQYVRLTDQSAIGLFEPTADAYDVDAVKALCGTAQ